ncbi:hypothetical protein [Polyangium spumosum]|uniref:Uncharacterized protein n=1 Tax=Polyangium spumosum TaxID=889282 RepID=A0A6N7PWU8_9BACT|nr:hypothetical protein [Polyangium spumosum]MRG95997.1 hypothetical protein [Polyangium spumosum]
MSSNHFITVSRAGDLMARRKGYPPVRVATAASGIEVDTDEAARAHGAPAVVRVSFAHGGRNRELRVMAVEADGISYDPDAFLARFEVRALTLGRWLRAAVERALDQAASSRSPR